MLTGRLSAVFRAAVGRLRRRVRQDEIVDRSGDFDAAFYLQEYSDIAAAGCDPEVHYLNFGRAEGRYPSAAAARDAARFRLTDLCNPDRDEPGPRTFDEAFRMSVLTPAYNSEPRYLRELYQTLRNQRYAHWEWVIVDDGSTDARTVATLRELAQGDPRIHLTLSPDNLGISGASNIALAAVSGTHTALVDHDDLVARDAFLSIYEAWKIASSAQLFFTDECKLLADGRLGQFWAKPDWSPAYLENTMCLGHLSVYETSFLRSLGGFRSDYDGTQDFDLALRASLTRPEVVHVPVFAYLWRVIPGSAATDIHEKHYAIERQGRAVLEYARHKHPDATVCPGWGAGYWRIHYPLPSPAPLLSYVIPTGGGSRTIRGENIDLSLNCIRSFENAQFYPNREYVVVHHGCLTPEQMTALAAINGVRLIRQNTGSLNFAEMVSIGVAAARGAFVCLLGDDVEAITHQGGHELVGYLAANSTVGAIGPMCLFEDGSIRQKGMLLSAFGPARAGSHQPADFGGHHAILRCRRECLFIDAAMMIMRKTIYEASGGFDEKFPLRYNEVDLGVRLRDRGLSCIVDPGVRVYHFDENEKPNVDFDEEEYSLLKYT